MAKPGDILSGMNSAEWDSFVSTAYPMLQKQVSKLSTLDKDYYDNAVKNATTVTAMAKQTRDSAREAMGVALSGQDAAGQGRADSLSATQAMGAGTNEAVDDANSVKQSIAQSILGVQTTLKNQALSDASSASGLASSRQQQGITNSANASAQKMQTIGTIASVAAMAF